MRNTRRLFKRITSLGFAGALAAGAALAAPAHRSAPAPRFAPAARSAPAPRGGGMSRAAVPRGTATRAPVGGRQTANGTARYGYGYGGYGGYGGYYGGGYPYYGYPYYGYPCYGWGWPYWGGYYGWYGYPYFGLSVGAYYGPGYVDGGGGEAYAPSGPAVVETDISPSKAEVVLDGVSAGSAKDFNGTWDELRIEPGRHTITFRRDGYKSLTIAFDATAGGHYVFDQELPKGEGEERIDRTAGPESPEPRPPGASARGLLRIRVQPDDAVVYLDGSYLGTGFELAGMHGALSVGQGEHLIEVTRPGYKGDARKVLVGNEGQAIVDVTLEHAAP